MICGCELVSQRTAPMELGLLVIASQNWTPGGVELVGGVRSYHSASGDGGAGRKTASLSLKVSNKTPNPLGLRPLTTKVESAEEAVNTTEVCCHNTCSQVFDMLGVTVNRLVPLI